MGDGENLKLNFDSSSFGVLLSPQTLDYLHAGMPWD